MDASRIERKAAETILERGVRVTLPAPRFLQMLGKKTVNATLRQPTLGTLHTVSSLALKAGFSFEGIDKGDLDAAHQLINQHAATAAKIIAVVLLNSRLKIKLFAGIYGWLLMDRINSRRLAEITVLIVTLSGVQDFTTTIRLIRTMTVTGARNLSPTDRGSHGAEQ